MLWFLITFAHYLIFKSMKERHLLLFVLLFSVSLLNAQKRPRLSTDATEYWYYIQFSAGEGVIQDMGNNANLLTKAKVDGNAAQLWKFTGTKDNYTIECKTGRKMNYASNYFQASSTSSVKFKLLSTANTTYAPGWELQRVGQSTCLNQSGKAGIDRELVQWKAGVGPNVLLCVAADPNTDLIPEESDARDEVWYYIQFKRGGGTVLQDLGDGQNLKTKVARKQDSQLWKVIKKADGYVIESKLGNKISYSGTYFQTSSTDYVEFNILQTANATYAPALELQRVGTLKCMNQWESPGINRLLGEWAHGNQNNPLVFVLPEHMKDLQEPDGKIRNYVGCTKLKNLQLPSCKAIGEGAFSLCTALEYLNFPYSTPPSYGKKAFANPENIAIEIDNQNATIVYKWRKIAEWNAFKWESSTNIETIGVAQWEIDVWGNNLIVSGLTPNVEVRIVSLAGTQYHFMPSQNGVLNTTLPAGFYIVNQYNKSEKIIVTK